MGALSGTVILCDQVYQAQGGKFVLAGTYTNIQVHCADLANVHHHIQGLQLYLRLRPEQLGPLTLEVMIRDEGQPPWGEPVLKTKWDIAVTQRNVRLVEIMTVSPPFAIQAQLSPEQRNRTDMTVKLSVEFRAAGEVVGTTPLDVTFVKAAPQ